MNFEELKNKVEQLKTKRDQSLGAIKAIEDGWEQKYGTRDVKAITARLAETKSELDAISADIQTKVAEAEKLLEGVA